MVRKPPLEKAVAYYLYEQSKDVPDEIAGIYRAAALALIKEPLSPELLKEAMKRESNDDPLYHRADIRSSPTLEEWWDRQR